MPTTTKTDNLDLWNRHEKTDPAITKKVDQRGGFTAICAMHQMKEATKEWGPFGTTWGLKDLRFGGIPNAAGEPLEAVMEAVFWYPGGEFPIATSMAYRAGNDSHKKLRTDCITKALSNLGFNADVFMGKFDDNKYVNEMNELFGNSNPPPKGSGREEVKDFMDGKPKNTDMERYKFAIAVAVKRDVPMCPAPTDATHKEWGKRIKEHAGLTTMAEIIAWVEKHAHFEPIEDNGAVVGANLILGPP